MQNAIEKTECQMHSTNTNRGWHPAWTDTASASSNSWSFTWHVTHSNQCLVVNGNDAPAQFLPISFKRHWPIFKSLGVWPADHCLAILARLFVDFQKLLPGLCTVRAGRCILKHDHGDPWSCFRMHGDRPLSWAL
jgi:hypothetical protein